MQELVFRLGDPAYTLLHRAGLAGLYMTLKQLEQEKITPVEGMQWDLSNPRQVVLRWEGQDQKSLAWLLHESFQLNEGLISLRGLDSRSMRVDAQAIVHQGILGTFLQHNSTHKADGVTTQSFQFEGEDAVQTQVSYKKLRSYVYQDFASNLCDDQGNFLRKPISVAGWLNPGAVVRHVAFSANTSFEETPENALVLLFAPVACYYYTLRSRLRDKRAQYALVVPEILDLQQYAKYRQNTNLRNAAYQDFYACGLGDAGLRFLTYETTVRLANTFPVPRCQVLTLGTVAWATQQKTRTDLYVVEANATVCHNYQVCRDFLRDKPVKSKEGAFIASSFARELITENLRRSQPWYTGIADKVNSNELFQRLAYERGGLYKVMQKVQTDEREKQFVRTCHEALYYTYGQTAAKTKQGEEPNFDKVTVRIRTSLGRCKNAASFREFIADFWSRAGKLPTLKDHWQELMQFVIQENQWKKSRDLALLALASYPGKVVMRQLLGEESAEDDIDQEPPQEQAFDQEPPQEQASVLGWDD
ncbi:type I-MYXAN CRISPR-associated Cas8a1/Cmx1 [Coleofasciculus sp. H7-2]|uniref:type I-MYXAN CRISPR-associated Cas8a1/Cmx1 n=1 Tax=Coleofasciculus sp. H7-2 TaxID=3351545 RepID=UPI00366D274A